MEHVCVVRTQLVILGDIAQMQQALRMAIQMQLMNVLAQATANVLLQLTLVTQITIYQYVNVVLICQTSIFATQEEIAKMLLDNHRAHALPSVIV